MCVWESKRGYGDPHPSYINKRNRSLREMQFSPDPQRAAVDYREVGLSLTVFRDARESCISRRLKPVGRCKFEGITSSPTPELRIITSESDT